MLLIVIVVEVTLLLSPDTLSYSVCGLTGALSYFVCGPFRRLLARVGISLTGTDENNAVLVRTETLKVSADSNVLANSNAPPTQMSPQRLSKPDRYRMVLRRYYIR